MATKEQLAQIDEAMKKINKKFGAGAIVNMNSSDNAVIKMDSGSLKLNEALGGGFAEGRIIEIYGPESSGKTTIALHAIASAQATGKVVAFIDMEHALDPLYAENLGVNVGELMVSQPDYGEQALDIVEELVNSGIVDLIVVDSVAALTPKAELDGEMGDVTVGAQARLMSKALRKITPVASQNKCTIIFINQIRMKIGMMGYGSPETTTGGNALKFYASQRIDIRRIGGIKGKRDGEEVEVGNKAKIKIVKNKVAPPFRVVQVEIYFGEGISKYAEVLDLAITFGFIKKAGSWFSCGDEKLGQGGDNVIKKFKDEPDFFNNIRQQVIQAMNDKRDVEAKPTNDKEIKKEA